MIPTVPPSPLIQDARDISGGIHKSLKNQQFQYIGVATVE